MKQKHLSKFDVEDRDVVNELSQVRIRHSLFGLNAEDFWALVVKIERHYKQKYLQEVARLEGQTKPRI